MRICIDPDEGAALDALCVAVKEDFEARKDEDSLAMARITASIRRGVPAGGGVLELEGLELALLKAFIRGYLYPSGKEDGPCYAALRECAGKLGL